MLKIETPDRIYKQLFEAVQSANLFGDSKLFVDAIPKRAPGTILKAYRKERQQPDFDLRAFVVNDFALPEKMEAAYEEDRQRSVREHIETLWDVLTRPADEAVDRSSLIPLPKPYIVPGGRFREIYYWDSYFTLLGQAASGRVEMLAFMVDNFAYLIDQVGFIPNGNRSYYCSRSQPPFFVLMVELLAETTNDDAVLGRYLPQLEKEYAFWMSGAEQLRKVGDASRRVIKTEGGYLNRYWDDSDQPRQESYIEDLELAEKSGRDPAQLYRDIRAACESGWDFTSRWFIDSRDMATINTSQVVPVDLNALMYHLEQTLAKACRLTGDLPRESVYAERARSRKQAIQSRFFDRESGFFVDLRLPDFVASPITSLAAAYPLFFRIATGEQAAAVAESIHTKFLKAGGWVTTLNHSGQQWDSPNGWAPLQWIVYKGLQNYGFDGRAKEGASRWIANNLKVYETTGKLVEKYNVEQLGLLAEGGEYTVQHGFGWTNGVLLQLMDELGL